jgi:hypothetical protein
MCFVGSKEGVQLGRLEILHSVVGSVRGRVTQAKDSGGDTRNRKWVQSLGPLDWPMGDTVQAFCNPSPKLGWPLHKVSMYHNRGWNVQIRQDPRIQRKPDTYILS